MDISITIAKLKNTELVDLKFENDGYGQFRNSFTQTEKYSLFSNFKFQHTLQTTTQMGYYSGGLNEKKRSGVWSIESPRFSDINKEACLVLKYDDGEVLKHGILRGKGYVILDSKRYEWNRISGFL